MSKGLTAELKGRYDRASSQLPRDSALGRVLKGRGPPSEPSDDSSSSDGTSNKDKDIRKNNFSSDDSDSDVFPE